MPDVRRVKQIPIEKLEDDPCNIRPRGDMDQIFREDIREHGIMQNLIVRPKPNSDKYYVTVGKRRFHAAKGEGKDTVPCEIKELTDLEARVESLRENEQRVDIPAWVIEEEIVGLVDEVVGEYESVEDAAGKLKEETGIPLALPTIRRYIRISTLPDHLKARLKGSKDRSRTEKEQLKEVTQPLEGEGEGEEAPAEIDMEGQIPQGVASELARNDDYMKWAKEEPRCAHRVATEAIEKGRDKVRSVIEKEKERIEEEKYGEELEELPSGYRICIPVEPEAWDLLQKYSDKYNLGSRKIAAMWCLGETLRAEFEEDYEREGPPIKHRAFD